MTTQPQQTTQNWMRQNTKNTKIRQKRNAALQLALWGSLPVGYLVCENPDLFSSFGKINVSYDNGHPQDKPVTEEPKPENPGQNAHSDAGAQSVNTDNPVLTTDTPTGEDIIKDPATDTGADQINADGGDSSLGKDGIAALVFIGFVVVAMLYALKKNSDLKAGEKALDDLTTKSSTPTSP